jgi:phage terminase large subunit-like protein
MSSKPSSKRRSAASSSATEPAAPWAAFAHPVDRYARRVLCDAKAGAPIVAGPLVRLAAARHLRDRETAPARGLTFDEVKATHALAFFPQFLRFADGLRAGEPFELQPWEVFIVGSLFGWQGADGARRFRTAYIEVGKGNGKTPLLAGIGLYLLVADQELSAEIYCAAYSAEQARVLFHDAERMVETSPLLKRRIESSVNNLAVPSTYSYFRPISSEHRALDGKRVHGALIDELHEHPNALVVDKMRAGTKGRTQALVVEITNAGYDRGSVCWAHHEMSRQTVERTVDNDSWFAFVCGVDEGDDPLVDETCWPKANPNLDVSIPAKYLREQVAEAVAMPTKANLVLRLNFCVWTQAETRAIDMTQWQACRPFPSDADLVGAPCFAGLDLGQSDDFCALVLIWALKDGRVAVRPRFWIPREALETYPARPYDAWRRTHALEVTDGPITNLDDVERAVAAECRAAGVREVAFDKRFAQQLAQHLTGQGITMVDTSQGFHLNEALTRLLELVVSGNLCHGNHPVLSWMASNAVVRHGHQGEIRLDKEHAAEKIDGIAALAMALDRYVRMPVNEPTYTMLVLGNRR